MQLSRKGLRRLSECLEAEYQRGQCFDEEPPLSAEPDSPLGILIITILSQASNDIRTRDVYRGLIQAFPTWEELAQAPESKVQQVLQPGGLFVQKTRYIQGVLHAIHEQVGEYTLDFLRAETDEEIRSYLSALPGVGEKTRACVMLFGLGRNAFPVDTHVARISRRLGLLPFTATPQRIQAALEGCVSEEVALPLHLNLLEHGRQVCTARRARCEQCVIMDWCDRVGIAASGRPT